MQAFGSRRQLWIIGGAILLFLVIVIFLVDFNDLIKLFRRINWFDLAVAAIVLLAGYLLITVLLRYLLFNQPGFMPTFYAISVGFMLNLLFVPGVVAMVVTTHWIAKVDIAQASSALLVQKVLYQIMRLSTLALIIILLAGQETGTSVSITSGLVLLVLTFVSIILVIRYKERVVTCLATQLSRTRGLDEEQIRSTASTVIAGLETISSTRRLMISLLLSYAAWICFLIFQYLVLDSLPLRLSVIQMWLIAAAVMAVMPPSINIIPILYHVVVILLLTTTQLTNVTVAVVYAILLHLLITINWTVLGNWSLIRNHLRLGQLVEAAKAQIANRRSKSSAGEGA